MTVLPDVSRETAARLDRLAALVAAWNPRINLVARGTVAALHERHIADSLQLADVAPAAPRLWADLGSGGGFPGLVVAAVLADRAPAARVVLVESDQRKAAFLRIAAADLGLRTEVIAARAEAVPPLAADVVSARALAALPALLPLVRRHLAPGGVALLPKGARHGDEIAAARARFRFDVAAIPSRTAPDAAILAVRDIRDA